MKFIPKEDRILIKPTPPEKFISGIEMFGQDVQQSNEGTVVATGPGLPVSEIHIHVHGDLNAEAAKVITDHIESRPKLKPMDYKPGDYVMYGKYAGTRVMLDDEEHIVVRHQDIFGIIE